MFEGVWSSGPQASLTLARNNAHALTVQGTAAGEAQVELEINGTSVYSGPANAIAGKPFPTGEADKLALSLHFTALPVPVPNEPDKIVAEGGHGLFLQGVTLQ